MKKEIINVPKGIRYITEWEEFTLPPYPCIIDKHITGCGFTEYVIRENFNAVLVSPRKSLLENKEAQHVYIDDSIPYTDPVIKKGIYYARCDSDRDLAVDRDLEAIKPKEIKEEEIQVIDINQFREDLNSAIDQFLLDHKPIKISVTYDSFRKVREVLEERGILNTFNIVIDEFQVIFTDSRFKSSTEIEFLSALGEIQNLCFVSATPMMEEYLDLVDEFKDLPYIKLDWAKEEPSRIIHPEIMARPTRSINETAKKIVTDFKAGKYEKKALLDHQGNPVEIVEARELVFYVNSVKNICDIIRQNKLMPEDVNIICARTEDNSKKLREAFRIVYRAEDRPSKELPKINEVIGSVPVPNKMTGEIKNKPITLCTKTVYLGADFYSNCAKSIIFSDSGIESLAVDITLDLPQIVGRQRSDLNPWKNSVDIYFKAGMGAGEISEEVFEARRNQKINKTNNLLEAYSVAPDHTKHDVAEKYLEGLKVNNYRNDYVAINKHNGSDIRPQFNQLVMIAEKRAYDIQQKDYKDRFAVYNTIDSTFGEGTTDLSRDINVFIEGIDNFSQFYDKMKYICYKLNACPEIYHELLQSIPEPFKMYIQVLGTSYILQVKGRRSELDKAINSRSTTKIHSEEDLMNLVINRYEVGSRYLKSQIKTELQEIYEELGIKRTAKASDLEQWFELKSLKITNKETGKRDHGFEIINIKQ